MACIFHLRRTALQKLQSTFTPFDLTPNLDVEDEMKSEVGGYQGGFTIDGDYFDRFARSPPNVLVVRKLYLWDHDFGRDFHTIYYSDLTPRLSERSLDHLSAKFSMVVELIAEV
ncbi:hypothetical protein RUM43_002569 [Polyplax serrata]|uniref:Uncharacterized protein n=1 Tax=Polyplax serrata TaxID=468196 RepID=A0AAN8PCX9_POLSC